MYRCDEGVATRTLIGDDVNSLAIFGLLFLDRFYHSPSRRRGIFVGMTGTVGPGVRAVVHWEGRPDGSVVIFEKSQTEPVPVDPTRPEPRMILDAICNTNRTLDTPDQNLNEIIASYLVRVGLSSPKMYSAMASIITGVTQKPVVSEITSSRPEILVEKVALPQTSSYFQLWTPAEIKPKLRDNLFKSPDDQALEAIVLKQINQGAGKYTKLVTELPVGGWSVTKDTAHKIYSYTANNMKYRWEDDTLDYYPLLPISFDAIAAAKATTKSKNPFFDWSAPQKRKNSSARSRGPPQLKTLCFNQIRSYIETEQYDFDSMVEIFQVSFDFNISELLFPTANYLITNTAHIRSEKNELSTAQIEAILLHSFRTFGHVIFSEALQSIEWACKRGSALIEHLLRELLINPKTVFRLWKHASTNNLQNVKRLCVEFASAMDLADIQKDPKYLNLSEADRAALNRESQMTYDSRMELTKKMAELKVLMDDEFDDEYLEDELENEDFEGEDEDFEGDEDEEFDEEEDWRTAT
eukprot:TRINITY_DN11457_c0_g1_i1.p1 TRINITY_DN11457_c0_g1~~TRINITY_DN11457_c0_g1_i1.p1  ORF type:complete len:524 (-),score=69.35 TRINITY_DN11457_c0_g1_i1:821-2392(-)